MKIHSIKPGIYCGEDSDAKVRIAISGREYGRGRHELFLEEVSVRRPNFFWLKQVHGDQIVKVTPSRKPQGDSCADALISSVPGTALGIFTADCIPLFIWDRRLSVVGIAHAGWRGVHQGIARKMVHAFRQNYASRFEDLRAVVGPGIRGCCYEVGSEFSEVFPEFYAPAERIADEYPDSVSSKGYLDLGKVIASDLEGAGLPPSHLTDLGWCTCCMKESFFSYRREKGTQERMISVIMLRR